MNIKKAIQHVRNRLEYSVFGGSTAISTEVVYLCLQALEEKAMRESPQPLTIEELKNRIEQPVYIQCLDVNEGFWVIRNTSAEMVTNTPRKAIMFHMRWYYYDDYGKTWAAYDYERKNENNGN